MLYINETMCFRSTTIFVTFYALLYYFCLLCSRVIFFSVEEGVGRYWCHLHVLQPITIFRAAQH